MSAQSTGALDVYNALAEMLPADLHARDVVTAGQGFLARWPGEPDPPDMGESPSAVQDPAGVLPTLRLWPMNIAKPAPIPVFVYGTLRVGYGNYRWTVPAVVGSDIGCKAQGRIYWVNGRRGFPVAKLDEDGEILGDVVWYDPSKQEYHDMCRMESGAGYEIREIDVTLPSGEVIKAQAWHYLREPRGDLIESGDWASETSGY